MPDASPLAALPEDSPFRPLGHDHLIVRGAREHNLKDISVELPRDALIVLHRAVRRRASPRWPSTRSSPRASGATSSRFSSYARQFLGQMDKPDVDFIEGLSPAVSIDQKSTNRNPRSTVGTITEVYDYLRLLFARAGRPHCPICGEPITRQTPQQIVDRLLELPDGTRFQVLAPVVKGRKGEYVDLFARAPDQGLLAGPRRRRGRLADRAAAAGEEAQAHHRGRRRPAGGQGRRRRSKRRLTDSVETALGLAGGVLLVEFVDVDPKRPGRAERRFSEKMACPNDHPIAIDEIEPRSFSFNAPYGACPRCTGIGTELEVDPELLVPDEDLLAGRGRHRAVVAGLGSADYFLRVITALGEDLSFSMDTPVEGAAGAGQGGAALRRELQGPRQVPATATAATAPTRPGSRASSRSSSGGTPRPTPTGAGSATRATCGRCPAPQCKGARLKPEILAVLIGGKNISEICALAINEARRRSSPTSTSRRASGRSPSGSSRRSRRGSGFLLDVASTTSRWTGRPARCPAARRSASGWPPRSGPAWSACSTSSTSRRSACTSATTTGSSRR